MTEQFLVTGGSGFVGGAVLQRLVDTGRTPVVAGVRTLDSNLPSPVKVVEVTGLSAGTNWSQALAGVEVVVHCAARAHVMKEYAADPLTVYRETNVAGTLALAHQAASEGVRRFIFLSSIKVIGEQNATRRPFQADDIPFPKDAYSISKWEAEQALHEVAARTSLEVVIIRPPLVYGPGVKGNFLSMLGWLKRGIPLPFGSIHNKRSLVGIANLVDLIMTCIEHPAAANQIFLVSDDEDLSTTELLRRMGSALRKPVRLIPVPEPIIYFCARFLGKKAIAQRLLGSLQVNISATKEILGWKPPIKVDEGLVKTSKWYLNQR